MGYYFVEHTFTKRDKVVTMTVCCMCVHASVHLSEFVWSISSTIVDRFQNNLTQLLLHHM